VIANPLRSPIAASIPHQGYRAVWPGRPASSTTSGAGRPLQRRLPVHDTGRGEAWGQRAASQLRWSAARAVWYRALARDVGPDDGGSATASARGAHTLGNWVTRDREAREGRGELTRDDMSELKRLPAEVAELRVERDVLKRSVVLPVLEATK